MARSGLFFCWVILVICLTIVLKVKLTVSVFTVHCSLVYIFRHSDQNNPTFFSHFKDILVWLKNDEKNNDLPINPCSFFNHIWYKRYFWHWPRSLDFLFHLHLPRLSWSSFFLHPFSSKSNILSTSLSFLDTLLSSCFGEFWKNA